MDHKQQNHAIRYQFRMNGTNRAPVRDTWEEAAEDAVQSGHAHWKNRHELWINEMEGAWIHRIREPRHVVD